jgi:hypothetical protein
MIAKAITRGKDLQEPATTVRKCLEHGGGLSRAITQFRIEQTRLHHFADICIVLGSANPELPAPAPLDRQKSLLCARYIDFTRSLSNAVLGFMATLLTTVSSRCIVSFISRYQSYAAAEAGH